MICIVKRWNCQDDCQDLELIPLEGGRSAVEGTGEDADKDGAIIVLGDSSAVLFVEAGIDGARDIWRDIRDATLVNDEEEARAAKVPITVAASVDHPGRDGRPHGAYAEQVCDCADLTFCLLCF